MATVVDYPGDLVEWSTDFTGLSGLYQIKELRETPRASWHSNSNRAHNRKANRVRYTEPIAITPFHTDTGSNLTLDESLLVIGKDLSWGGVSFYHQHPLAHREVVTSFLVDDGRVISLKTRLLWCRFTTQGYYHTGGTFVRDVDHPLFEFIPWSELPSA